MRKDFQIAILLALAAIPAGTALMAAPDYLPLLKEYPGPFFWGGLILAAGLIGAAIIIAVRGEASEPRAGHRRRMIGLMGMVIFGLGFLGSAAVYFWPARSSTPSAPATTEQANNVPTLADLSNTQLRERTSKLTERLRQFESEFDVMNRTLSDQERNQYFNIPYNNQIERNNQWKEYIAKEIDRHTRHVAEFKVRFLGDALALRDVLCSKVGIFRPYPKDMRALPLDYGGNLSGPYPLMELSNYLDELARKLPD